MTCKIPSMAASDTELNLTLIIFINEVYYKPQILPLTAHKSQTNTTHNYWQQLNYIIP